MQSLLLQHINMIYYLVTLWNSVRKFHNCWLNIIICIITYPVLSYRFEKKISVSNLNVNIQHVSNRVYLIRHSASAYRSMYVLHSIETDERIKRILGAGILADNLILEKRTSRSSVDLGHWFEACWITDCVPPILLLPHGLWSLLESLGDQRCIQGYLNVET